MSSIAHKLVGLIACFVACSAPSSSSPPSSPGTLGPAQGTADWSCQTSIAVQPTLTGAPATRSAAVSRPKLTVRAVLALTSQPQKGLDVRTCDQAPCNVPISGGTTDENGVATLWPWGDTVTVGGTSSSSEFTTSYPLNVFSVTQSTTSLDAEVYNEVALVEATQLAGVPHVDGTATLTARVTDCSGTPAAGVTLLLPGADDRTVALYHEGDQPLPTGHASTGVTGRAMIFNLRAGHYVLLARDVRTGMQVAAFSGYAPVNGIAHAELAPAR